MLQFIHANGATVLVLCALILCVFFAVRHMIKNKKAGIGACGQNCQNCPYNASCDKTMREH